MKNIYAPAELEIIELEARDIVTASTGNNDDEYNGSFDGGYDAGGWT